MEKKERKKITFSSESFCFPSFEVKLDVEQHNQDDDDDADYDED